MAYQIASYMSLLRNTAMLFNCNCTCVATVSKNVPVRSETPTMQKSIYTWFTNAVSFFQGNSILRKGYYGFQNKAMAHKDYGHFNTNMKISNLIVWGQTLKISNGVGLNLEIFLTMEILTSKYIGFTMVDIISFKNTFSIKKVWPS